MAILADLILGLTLFHVGAYQFYFNSTHQRGLRNFCILFNDSQSLLDHR